MRQLRFLLCLAFLLSPIYCFGLPGESIVLDPNTGNYTITYFGINPETGKRDLLHSATFEPATKINPTIRSLFKMGRHGVMAYDFHIINSGTSIQPLVMVITEPVSSLIATDSLIQPEFERKPNATAHDWGAASYSLRSPSGWTPRVSTNSDGKLRVSFSSIKSRLPPGGTLNDVTLFSMDLPGISKCSFRGRSAIRRFPDEGPIGEVGDQLEQLVNNDFVQRYAAIPTITAPTPFDAATLLDRIRTEMNSWSAKQLLDPAYAAQLDRYMVAAAEAYRLNNAKAGKEHIKTIRKMLAKEHHNLDHDDEGDEDAEEHKTAIRFSIDRLAARVLDFDLRYVLMRMEPEEEGTHH